MKDGDRNTNFFYWRASTRQGKNRIAGLKDNRDVWHEDDLGIEGVVTHYFSRIFSSNHSPLDGKILDAIKIRVTEDMNISLMREFEVERINRVGFQVQPSTCLGPDGIPSLFFQKV